MTTRICAPCAVKDSKKVWCPGAASIISKGLVPPVLGIDSQDGVHSEAHERQDYE
eukprot:CAMPEP_0183560142 /NCGR_PEP_ID=MMETSP0371-20130417/93942_1 /TAXON_ID=268820 /ORGANISM="Peridinium aciculiferum, Strain PAER-2" /LENGTH=54 /DNA_ID=CAMNT_0025768257 /DNA_START=104 /DNA_END=268 /DNA_ORIENTATION=+